MGRATPGLEPYAPWVALMAAFSPVLADLAQNLAEHPEDRVTLLAPLLLLVAIRGSAAGGTQGRRAAAVVIAMGVALEVVGILAHSLSIARLGLPVAALGVARWTGRPPIVVTALLFFAIPLPDSVVSLVSPVMESALAQTAAAIFAALGVSLQAIGPSLVASAGRIDLLPGDSGATQALAVATLGWYSAARNGRGVAQAGLRAALCCLLAIPLQLLALLVAGALLAVGLPDAGEQWLGHVAWIVTSVLGLAWLHRRPGVERAS